MTPLEPPFEPEYGLLRPGLRWPVRVPLPHLLPQPVPPPWRVIYNDDGDDYHQPDADAFLNLRLRPLKSTQVDMVLLDPFSTELMPIFPIDNPAKPMLGTYWPDYLENKSEKGSGRCPILTSGGDALELALECCHGMARPDAPNGYVDLFVTFRMNDAQEIDNFWQSAWRPLNSADPPGHTPPDDQWFLEEWEAWYASGDPYFSRWKMRHPECLLGGDCIAALEHGVAPPYDPSRLPDGDPRYRITSKNYARPEVRERTIVAVWDVCSNYDLDGIELDFVKGPVHFPETFSPTPRRVSQTRTDEMTNLVSAVRYITQLIGAERGRPLKLATRVPESEIQARFIGLDVRRWLHDDLIDVLIAGSGHAPRNAMEPIAHTVNTLGAQFRVPVYGAITPELETMARQPAAWRAAAMNVHHANAGVYTFNYFGGQGGSVYFSDAEYLAVLQQIGSSQTTLQGGPRLYGMDCLQTDLDRAITGTGDAQNFVRCVGALDAALVVAGNPYGDPTLLSDPSVPTTLPQILVATWNRFEVAIGEQLDPSASVIIHLYILGASLPASGVHGDSVMVRVNTKPLGGVAGATYTAVANVTYPTRAARIDVVCTTAEIGYFNTPGVNEISLKLDYPDGYSTTPRVLIGLDVEVDA